jgi:hypothetical protein
MSADSKDLRSTKEYDSMEALYNTFDYIYIYN